jgi:F0F1-type ATP synthase assembly protein I
LKRAATRSGGGAYEGAFEAVGSILVATGLGYWFDHHYETTPIGVLVGAVVGFAAFVLRLFRLGRQLHPEGSATEPGAEKGETDQTGEKGERLRADDAGAGEASDTGTDEERS